MLKYRVRFVALAVLTAVMLSACRSTQVPHTSGPVEAVPVAPIETVSSHWIPTEPDGLILKTPAVLDGKDVKNRYDEFPQDEIAVCNSRYTIPKNLSDAVYAIMDEYDFDCTFYVIDLGTGMSIGYNPEELQAVASTVKAGFCFSCMTDIAQTEHTLEDKMTYRPKHKLSGSGSTQYSTFGTIFTIKALLYRTLYNSDNTAYLMLMDYFGTDHYNALMAELGVSHRLNWDEERWGYMSAHDLGLIWQAIYRYRDQNEEGALLWEYLTTNLYNEIHDTLTEYETVAHKSGWNEEGYHDAGVVCTENGDYVVVVMTKTGDRNRCLHRVIRALDDIMKDYYQTIATQR